MRLLKNTTLILAILFITLVFISACAATPRGRAVQFVMASDAMADELADGWEPFVLDSVARCRETVTEDTKEARKECMGIAGEGEKLEVALQGLVVVQKSIELAVHCESNPLDVPAEFMKQCLLNKKADWKDLFTQLMAAWGYIRPFYNAMKSGKAE